MASRQPSPFPDVSTPQSVSVTIRLRNPNVLIIDQANIYPNVVKDLEAQYMEVGATVRHLRHAADSPAAAALHAADAADLIVIIPAISPQPNLDDFLARCRSQHRRLPIAVLGYPAISDFDIPSVRAASPDYDLSHAKAAASVDGSVTGDVLTASEDDQDASSTSNGSTAYSARRDVAFGMTSIVTSSQAIPAPLPSVDITAAIAKPIPDAPAGTEPSLTLVGAGPGDPSLLTLAALSALQSSTLVISDRLVPDAIRRLIPPATPVLMAGKWPGRAAVAQREIDTWMLAGIARNHRVCRLKGGDPFLFGRGGEEILTVRCGSDVGARVPIRVVPGLSSSLAAPLMAGVPVTHRGVADQVLIVTGQRRDGRAPSLPAYHPSRTVVLLMAMTRLDAIVKVMMGGEGEDMEGGAAERGLGYPASTPAVIVERAGWEGQRVIRCWLRDAPERVAEAGISSHATMVVGHVADVLQGLGLVEDPASPNKGSLESLGGVLGGCLFYK